MVEQINCVHCGAVAKHPVIKTIGDQILHFCCGGCLQVYEMMLEEGLPPADNKPGKQNPSPPVANLQPGANGKIQRIMLPVIGMTCTNCVTSVERSLRKVAGVIHVSVDLAKGEAAIDIDPERTTMDSLKKAVKTAGYRVP